MPLLATRRSPPNAHRASPRVQWLIVENTEQPELVAVCEERGIRLV